MAFIELTLRSTKLKTVINIEHIVRYNAYKDDAREVTGSAIYLSTPTYSDGHRLVVDEKPERIEWLITSAAVPVLR